MLEDDEDEGAPLLSPAKVSAASSASPRPPAGGPWRQLCITMTNAMEGADAGLLSASMKFLEHDCKISPAKLGEVVMTQSLTFCLSMPLWSFLLSRSAHRTILALSCYLSGVVTLVLAFACSFSALVALKVCHGFAFSSVVPLTTAIIPGAVAAHQLGVAFGWVQFASHLSRILSTLLTTVFADAAFLGLAGWRWPWVVLGFATCVLGAIIHASPNAIWDVDLNGNSRAGGGKGGLGSGPGRSGGSADGGGGGAELDDDGGGGDTGRTVSGRARKSGAAPGGGACASLRSTLAAERRKIGQVVTLPTFWVLTCAGVVGCVPWNALSFMLMFYQYCEFSNVQAGCLVSVYSSGAALGSVFGGQVGDWAAQRYPQHGRASVAQASIALGSGFIALVLRGLPRTHAWFAPHALAAFAFGFTATWVGPGVDRPIFATVVRAEVRTTIQSYWFLLAGTFGAVAGAPAVGWMAETFYGYKMPAGGADAVASAAEAAANADALSRALLVCTLVPWALCFCCYSLLHFTLPSDYRHIREQQRAGASKQ